MYNARSKIAERKHKRSDIVDFYRNGTERFGSSPKFSRSKRNVSIRFKIFDIETERFASFQKMLLSEQNFLIRSRSFDIETKRFYMLKEFWYRNGTFRFVPKIFQYRNVPFRYFAVSERNVRVQW